MTLNVGQYIDNIGYPVIVGSDTRVLNGHKRGVTVRSYLKKCVDRHILDPWEGLVHELKQFLAYGHQEAKILMHELRKLSDNIPIYYFHEF